MTPRRLSTKHGPHLDDQLKDETRALEQGGRDEARAEEGRLVEGAGDAEERPEVAGSTGVPDDPALARRQLSRHLSTTVFPATRTELIADATDHDAPEPVLALLAELPENGTYGTVYEVWHALGGELEPGIRELLDERERGDGGEER